MNYSTTRSLAFLEMHLPLADDFGCPGFELLSWLLQCFGHIQSKNKMLSQFVFNYLSICGNVFKSSKSKKKSGIISSSKEIEYSYLLLHVG